MQIIGTCKYYLLVPNKAQSIHINVTPLVKALWIRMYWAASCACILCGLYQFDYCRTEHFRYLAHSAYRRCRVESNPVCARPSTWHRACAWPSRRMVPVSPKSSRRRLPRMLWIIRWAQPICAAQARAGKAFLCMSAVLRHQGLFSPSLNADSDLTRKGS